MEAQELPRVTKDKLGPGLSAGEIDAAVRAYTMGGEAIYELDIEKLHEVEPDLIVTQALCAVCAVSFDDVEAVAQTIESTPRVIALDPKTIGETMGDIRTVAQMTDSREAALDLVARQRARIDAVKLAVRRAERPSVLCIEWLDPVFIAGHWTPQLVDLAGGIDVLGMPGEHSEQTTWEALHGLAVDLVICMPCGYDAPRAHLEATLFGHELAKIGAGRVVAVDASATFSRPGPRLVDGLELLGHLLHPELVPDPGLPVLDVEL